MRKLHHHEGHGYVGDRAATSWIFMSQRADGNKADARNHARKRRSMPNSKHIVQELCESRGGRPGLSVLTSLLVSVDVKLY